MKEAGYEGISGVLSRSGVSAYVPQGNDRTAMESGIITYTHHQIFTNSLFKEQVPKQLNSLLT